MNSRKENFGETLDTVLASQLLDRVAELEKDVALLKSVSAWPLFASELSHTEKKKPGPKEKISDEELFRYRDGLIVWLEPFWPWMRDRLVAAGTVAEVEAILEAVAPEPEYRAGWQNRVLQNAVALCEFLWDERFRKTELPRATVAAALTLPRDDERGERSQSVARPPDCQRHGWRSGCRLAQIADRCSKRPSTLAIALNTDLYYRDRLGISAPKGLDLTRLWSRLPKFVPPILVRFSNRTKDG